MTHILGAFPTRPPPPPQLQAGSPQGGEAAAATAARRGHRSAQLTPHCGCISGMMPACAHS
eukprot:1159033-Pelagomonas_calceolata.AAC.5